jgi:Tfp pilus assembly protein PilW
MKGFSLIEIIIAIAILMTITLTISEFIPIQNQMASLNIKATQQNTNEQIALNLMIPAIRKTGYLGCQSAFNPSTSILPLKGFDTNTGFPKEIKNKIGNQSEALLLNQFAIPQYQISVPENATHLNVSKNFVVNAGEEIIITDCINYDNVHVKSIQGGVLYFESGEKIINQYQTAFIATSQSAYFYQGKTDRKDKNGEPIYALYRQPLSGSRQELIEGIQSLKFEYVLDNDFIKANQISDWKKVKRVKIIIQMQDQLFSTEVALRNAIN